MTESQKREKMKNLNEEFNMAVFNELAAEIKHLNNLITEGKINKKKWLSVTGLSEYLDLSESKIRKLVSGDKIPYRRIGENGSIRFNRKAIDLWLLTNKLKPNKRDKSQVEILL